jgi:hypothetical protein
MKAEKESADKKAIDDNMEDNEVEGVCNSRLISTAKPHTKDTDSLWLFKL